MVSDGWVQIGEREPYAGPGVGAWLLFAYLGTLLLLFSFDLTGAVDHTILSANATPEDVRKLCQEAVQFGFQAVCVNGCNVKLAQDTLKSLGSDVKVCAVVGFPLGASASSVKSFETLQAIEDGASEIDMVVNVGRIKAQEWDYVLRDISDVVSVCKQKNVVCKVILETCLLTDEEKKAVSRLSALAGADFVKTSTGFSTGGATVDDVRLMYGSVRTLSEIVPYADGKEPEVQVKASGGIRSVKDAEEMLRNGATRLGTSRAAGWCQGSSGKKQVAESTY